MAQKTAANDPVTVAESPAESAETVRYESVDGGDLVFEVLTEYRPMLGREKEIGTKLLGFANVDDWDALRSVVARRGYGAGTIYHKPEFN